MRTFEITYAPKFIKNLKKTKGDLKEEILNRVEMLADESNHEMLKVHKLKGRLKDRYIAPAFQIPTFISHIHKQKFYFV